MSTDREDVKLMVCPACFAREIDVCVMHYDKKDHEYYCTKCAYAGKEEEVNDFFAIYKKQKYKFLAKSHRDIGASYYSNQISVWVNDVKMNTYETDCACFVSAFCEGEVKVKIKCELQNGKVKISPQNLYIAAIQEDGFFTFTLNAPQHLYMEIEGYEKPLFFYGNKKKETNCNATYYYPAGKVYEIETLMLSDGESVYIEEGAIVRGHIHTKKNAVNIKIGGFGILDAGIEAEENSRTILMDSCEHSIIEDITIINTPCWHMMLAGCNQIVVRNVKEIGEVCGSDGVDIVGSHHITVENCIFRNNDDCIAIKAFEGGYLDGDGNVVGDNAVSRWNGPTENILIQDCIFINAVCGNGIEIGHELQVDEVKNIIFRNLDLVRCDGYGASISIHAGDRAVVKDIIFEDIRIEHYSDFLIDFRVMCSRFNKDDKRGQIRDILLKNIQVNKTMHNSGYCISVMGGYDSEHTVENITFEDFYLGENKVWDEDALELFTKNTKNIVFR